MKQALLELKAIKETKPSEAMDYLDQFINEMTRCLENPKQYSKNYDKEIFYKYKHTLETTIKQSLQRLNEIDNAIAICKKANEQKYVYIKENYGIIKEKFLDNLDYEVLNNRLYVNSKGIYYDFPLNDYGNWWALTKEELNSGN